LAVFCRSLQCPYVLLRPCGLQPGPNRVVAGLDEVLMGELSVSAESCGYSPVVEW
jgi:hypothetical protein